MIPAILAESLAIYREISYAWRMGKMIKKGTSLVYNGLASKQSRAQVSRDFDEGFPLFAVLLLSDTTRRLKVPIGDDIPMLKLATTVVKSQNYAAANEDPISKMATFMRLFSHEYATSGIGAASDLSEAVAKLKKRADWMDLVTNAALRPETRELAARTLLTDEIITAVYPDHEQATNAREFIGAYVDYMSGGGKLSTNAETRQYIDSFIVGEVFMPEVWLVMMQSAMIAAIAADSRSAEAKLGTLTMLGDSMVLGTPSLSAPLSKRIRVQQRSLTRLDITNAENKMIEHYGIVPIENIHKSKDKS